MRTRRDVVVIGAGLLGLAAARALTTRGADVIVLEQAEIGHEAGGSKGSCRIFRLGYPDAGYVTLARRSREPWADLEEASGQRLLHPVPQLTFGPGHQDVKAAMDSAGAACEVLQPAAVAARFPQLTVSGPALLEPESCVISAEGALRALAGGLHDVRTGVTVTGLTDDGRHVSVRTAERAARGGAADEDRDIITARAAVVCAGPWASGLLARAGIALPSSATLEQVAYLAPAAATAASIPIFIGHGDAEPYGLPVPGSALYKIGYHHSGPPVNPSSQQQSPDAGLIDRLTGLARRYLPGLHPEPVQTERCVYDNSPDEDFIVDRVGNVVIGCGTSGHGFKFGPLIGEWLADLAIGGDADPAARRFALGRLCPPGESSR